MVLQKTHKDYISFLQKRFNILFLLFIVSNNLIAQDVVQFFRKDSLEPYLEKTVSFTNKTIPTKFDTAIRIALSFYPELKDVKIKIRVKNKLAPLAARPTIWSLFLKPSKRKYIITISNTTIKFLNPILLKNLGFNSQIGVLGHELAHISEYNSKKGIFFIGLALKHLSKKQMDTFEYNTDKRSIEHGLGYQLLCWSKEVRDKLTLNQWGGANSPKGKRERYMNPETIIKTMKELVIYK